MAAHQNMNRFLLTCIRIGGSVKSERMSVCTFIDCIKVQEEQGDDPPTLPLQPNAPTSLTHDYTFFYPYTPALP